MGWKTPCRGQKDRERLSRAFQFVKAIGVIDPAMGLSWRNSKLLVAHTQSLMPSLRQNVELTLDLQAIGMGTVGLGDLGKFRGGFIEIIQHQPAQSCIGVKTIRVGQRCHERRISLRNSRAV